MTNEEKKAYNKAWREAHREERKAYMKAYKDAHKEETKVYNKAYKDAHKEKVKAYRDAHKEEAKAYRDAHKEEKKAYNKAYYAAHKEEAKAWRDIHREERNTYLKAYYAAHKEEIKAYYKTLKGRIVSMCNTNNQKDKQKGFDISNNITFEQALALIESHDCYYCGENDKMQLGLDRIDNNKPHTPDNVIVACGKCNCGRRDRFTVSEYKQRKQSA